MSRSRACGFTFIEVLAILLVVSLGLMATIGLVFYGIIQTERSKGATLGMVTAVSIAQDLQPLLPTAYAARWSYLPYDLDAHGQLTGTATGMVNGFYVVRTETSDDDDIIAQDGGVVYMRSAQVDVDVYQGLLNTLVTSFSTRIVRQRGTLKP